MLLYYRGLPTVPFHIPQNLMVSNYLLYLSSPTPPSREFLGFVFSSSSDFATVCIRTLSTRVGLHINEPPLYPFSTPKDENLAMLYKARATGNPCESGHLKYSDTLRRSSCLRQILKGSGILTASPSLCRGFLCAQYSRSLVLSPKP